MFYYILFIFLPLNDLFVAGTNDLRPRQSLCTLTTKVITESSSLLHLKRTCKKNKRCMRKNSVTFFVFSSVNI